MLRIKELRLERGLTQKELAKRIDTTDKSIWGYENQIAVPPLDVLTKLADFFNCSIDYLTGRADDFGNVTVKQDGNAELTAEELEVLRCYRILSRTEQEQLKGYAMFMADKWKK